MLGIQQNHVQKMFAKDVDLEAIPSYSAKIKRSASSVRILRRMLGIRQACVQNNGANFVKMKS